MSVDELTDLSLAQRATLAAVAGRGVHAGACCSKRVSIMWSAARSAIETIVDVGFTPVDVTKHDPSTT